MQSPAPSRSQQASLLMLKGMTKTFSGLLSKRQAGDVVLEALAQQHPTSLYNANATKIPTRCSELYNREARPPPPAGQ
jgi:hypothetical protein